MKEHHAFIDRAFALMFLAGILLLALPSLSKGQEAGEADIPASERSPLILEPKPKAILPDLVPFVYNAKGRRDPFIPLITKGSDETAPSLASLMLTGLIWNRNDKLAILEDPAGRGYPLRIGDRLGSATLVDIRDNSVLFKVLLYGEVHMHTLKLIRKEEL
jgi:hypothetical protein